MCGEQPGLDRFFAAVIGSPPRVRGTACGGIRPPAPNRITPACAGNRHHFARRPYRHMDHPRVCGEQFTPFSRTTGATGSPPRVRGTEVEPAQVEAAQGITPACAGNRVLVEGELQNRKDHPRVCGEQ